MEIEAVTPTFAAEFSTIPVEFSLDAFHYPEPAVSWQNRKITFPESVSNLSLYLPDDWCQLKDEYGHVNVKDSIGGLGQSARLEALQTLAPDVEWFLAERRIVAFAFYPVILEAGILRWILVSERVAGYTVCALHCGADNVLVVNGQAYDLETLRRQLSSAINTDPWRSFD